MHPLDQVLLVHPPDLLLDPLVRAVDLVFPKSMELHLVYPAVSVPHLVLVLEDLVLHSEVQEHLLDQVLLSVHLLDLLSDLQV